MAKTHNRPKRKKARTRAFLTRMVLSRMNGSAYYRKKVEASGGVEAHGCIFRMVERPPCDPFRRLPSHAEALRMLARAGLLDPDDFGHWNGTDFAQRQATSTLWWAYVRLLIESGKITGADSGEASDAALVTLGFPPHRTPG